ncbi:MAG: RsmD family RNA methyltransferase [Gemmatimonadetes bacterium]|jgi:16S rRNA (guanine966-N2)-methyltransferase|nr:RsmD family RNA methyltransferase [Gemmatimonadota bacterium]
MRIVGGKLAGRNLTSPGKAVRPTAEAVRDAWITLLQDELAGARVLDLFAGSGAVGLEALSRGARFVDFVENGAPALHSLKANVAALRASQKCRIFKQDAIPYVARLTENSYDIALADPPYGSGKLDRVIQQWREVPFAPILALEHSKDHPLVPHGQRYDFGGPTRLTILRVK